MPVLTHNRKGQPCCNTGYFMPCQTYTEFVIKITHQSETLVDYDFTLFVHPGYDNLFEAKALKTLMCVVSKDTRRTEDKSPWYIMRINSLISPS
jgi:hypothetical protein